VYGSVSGKNASICADIQLSADKFFSDAIQSLLGADRYHQRHPEFREGLISAIASHEDDWCSTFISLHREVVENADQSPGGLPLSVYPNIIEAWKKEALSFGFVVGRRCGNSWQSENIHRIRGQLEGGEPQMPDLFKVLQEPLEWLM
jgi:hypothetical protein